MRDFIGYGDRPPKVRWENDARVAVQFVINYEEGGERCVLDGDAGSESFLSEIIGAESFTGIRHMNMETIYEYGSRVGFWRLYRLFTERAVPVTVFAVASALAKNADAVVAMRAADWEIASHGYRWIDYAFMPEEEERMHLQTALQMHEQCVGEKPQGWYIGRTSPNTRRLLLEMGDWLYDADSYADDLPYWMYYKERPHLIMPYTLDVNDMRFATAQGFNCGEQFYHYLKDSFDVLYAEGQTAPKMMSIGLHCRLAGRPGRFAALVRFMDYLSEKTDVWLCRRADIAKHWRNHHPAPPYTEGMQNVIA